MPRAFNIVLHERAAGSDECAAGEIPDADWTRLIEYADEVVRMENAAIFQRDLRVSMKLVGEPSGSLRCECIFPSDDDICVLLHRLRPFVLKDETTNFFRIANILSRYIANEAARKLIRSQHDRYSGKDFQSQLRIDWKSPESSCVMNSDETLMRWLNAFEYHRDSTKQREIEEFYRLLPEDVPRAVFLSMLLDKVKAILNIAVLIRTIERSNGVPLTY